MPNFDDASGDTVLSTRYAFEKAVSMIEEAQRFVSFEVGAMVGMELCERHLEGWSLAPQYLWIDVIGHLIVGKKRTPGAEELEPALMLLRQAIHPAGHEAFDRLLGRAASGGERPVDLRDRFANVLFPIDRASARFSLARCLESAASKTELPASESLEGMGPDSVEMVLSNLDDTVFTRRPRELEITPSRSRQQSGPTPDDAPADQYGRFGIFGEIAQGGMAQVLLARDPRDSGRPCVLKRLLPSLSGQESYRKMFTDEAALGLCLEHQHICRTLEFLEVEGELCIKMEWAAGLTLSNLLSRVRKAGQRLTVGFVLRLGEALTTALAYAHDARGPSGAPLRVVHRDVSPQNVIVQYDGSVKLLDFGVARSAVQGESSEGGHVKGKFAYMSPEQSLGKPIDDRSDVFCVGICLYEALTGRPLFDRKDRLGVVRALAQGELPDLSVHRPDAPPHVRSLLQRALASAVSTRPRMKELVSLLQEAQMRVEVRPDEVTRAVRQVDPEWRDWRAKLTPYEREVVEEPTDEATQPWKSVAGLVPAGKRLPQFWSDEWDSQTAETDPQRKVRATPTRVSISWAWVAAAGIAVGLAIGVAMVWLS